MRFGAVIALSLLCALPGAARAAAEPPAALVTAVSGGTNPAVTAMSEIASGAPIRLEPSAELTLLDYARCKMVTVSGGTVTVTRFDFLTDGKIIAEIDAPCPRVHKLSAGAGGAVTGGLVMRGVAGPPRWPLSREIVVAGDSSDKLAAAAIYTDGKLDAPLVKLDVSGRQAQFPPDASALAVGERYVLRLALSDHAQPVDIPFIAAAPSESGLLVVLRSQ